MKLALQMQVLLEKVTKLIQCASEYLVGLLKLQQKPMMKNNHLRNRIQKVNTLQKEIGIAHQKTLKYNFCQ